MKIPKHKIKLKKAEWEAMHTAHSIMLELFVAKTPHDELLKAHLDVLQLKMYYQVLEDRSTLSLDNREALAFTQIWWHHGIALNPFAANVLRVMLDVLEQKTTSLKLITK